MVSTTKRDGKFVAHLSCHCTALSEAEVMRVRGMSAAYQAGLLGNKLNVFPIADAARFRQPQRAFIYRLCSRFFPGVSDLSAWCFQGLPVYLGCTPQSVPSALSFASKACSTHPASTAVNLFFSAKTPMSPQCSIIGGSEIRDFSDQPIT